MQEQGNKLTFIEFLPVSFFGAIMGLCGLCFSWRQASEFWHVNGDIGELIGFIAVAAFVLLSITFLVKFLKFTSLVSREFSNPVSISFFATIIVCLLLIPGVILPYFPILAVVIWSVGAVLIVLFAWYVLRKWIDNQQNPGDALPVWILPVVGTLDVPVVGNRLSFHGAHEICLMFLGIGVIFALMLLTIIFSRLLFQNPLPQAVQPTLLILTGPFALAFIGYEGLTAAQDVFSGVVFYFNILLFLLLASKIALLPKVCPFQVSWWAVSFPLTAITVSSILYAKHKPDWVHQLAAIFFLALTTLVIGYLAVISVYKIISGKFVPKQ